MAYATAPDLTSGDWTFGNVIMYPTSTSNTNHMAVFDFKGKTYFVYHNGSLQGGNGYRRSACITELHFNDDGSIDYFEETTAGLAGTTVTLQSAADDGALLSHEGFVNSPTDADYPMKKVKVGTGLGDLPTDEKWVLCDGKADASNEYYVSIQSENKSGLYLTAQADGTVVLAQDTDAAEETAQAQTFHSMEGLSDKKGVSFEALSSLDAPVSFWKGIPFGLQHVMAMFVANLAPIFLVASAANMSAEQSATIIQAGLLVAGLGTCLQLYGVWLIGSRLPMVTGISFTYVAAAMSIAQNQGYGAVAGAVVLGGLLEVVLGLTAKYWRRFVPPIVSAIVVTSIGFSLLSVGATSFGGGSGAEDFGSWQNLTLGLISLVACLAFQLLMKGTAKQLSVLFGLVVGYVVAIFMGKVDFSGFANLQVVSVPHFMPFQLEFDPGAIISFALLYVVSSVEVLGDTAALTKVGLDRQPTDKETAGAIAGDGLISSVSGLFGCLPLTSFAQNIGLVAMTKVVNRKVILSGGLILMIASFVPAVAEVFNSLPQAVLGGCTIMMFGNIILSGFQMISEAGYTQRNITIAALSLTIGIGFTQVGDIFVNFPPLFQSIFASNCIAVAFVVAVLLNALLPSEEHFLSAPQHQED